MPAWSSPMGGQGTGPGSAIRLFEIGHQSSDATYGLFALTIDLLGNTLSFSTEANGIHTENASCPISFNSKNWYQIVLTYTTSNSLLYVNNTCLATNGLGLTNIPSLNVIQQG